MVPFLLPEGVLLVVTMRLLFTLRPKRKIAILGTACTGVVAGLFLFNKILPTATSCQLSCTATESASYAFLQRNEARVIVRDHPLISAVEVNYLPSNNPNEDRFVSGSSRELGMGLFAVLDGHKGPHCSEHLRQRLLPHLMKSLADKGLLKDTHVDLYSLNTSDLDYHPQSTVHLPPSTDPQDQDKLASFEETVKQAFVSLDKEITDTALQAVRQIRQGRSVTAGNLRSDVLKGVAGACALLTMITERTLTVASTGDCRAVVGTRDGGGWGVVPMSVDQNAQNKDEVDRLNEAHPKEEQTIITMGRLLGSLMPLRSFGDVEYKWSLADLRNLLQVPMFYHTPPYLTAEPVVTKRVLQRGDRFVVLATDGLWERMSNEQVVRTVGEVVEPKQQQPSSLLWLRSKSQKKCCNENAATRLLWESLGGEEKVVNRLLQVSAPYSRAVRDDITLVVIHLHNL